MIPSVSSDKAQRLYDADYARRYRGNDIAALAAPDGQRTAAALANACERLGRDLTVLDVGCGTGRYFHCLRSVKRLVAIDASAEMLDHARDPIHAEQVRRQIENIELRHADVRTVGLPAESFDLVYSIGVLGQHAPFDVDVFHRLYGLVRPGGRLFFTIVDVHSQWPALSVKRRLAERVIALLPNGRLKGRIRNALKSHFLSRGELEWILRQCGDARSTVERHESACSLWRGAVFECLIEKPAHPPAGGPSA